MFYTQIVEAGPARWDNAFYQGNVLGRICSRRKKSGSFFKSKPKRGHCHIINLNRGRKSSSRCLYSPKPQSIPVAIETRRPFLAPDVVLGLLLPQSSMCSTGSEGKPLCYPWGRGMGERGNVIPQGGGNTTPCLSRRLSGQWEGWRTHFVPPGAALLLMEREGDLRPEPRGCGQSRQGHAPSSGCAPHQGMAPPLFLLPTPKHPTKTVTPHQNACSTARQPLEIIYVAGLYFCQDLCPKSETECAVTVEITSEEL